MLGKVVTFGEVMMRLSPPGFLRLVQARALDVTFGGSEANVAISLAIFGVPVDHVTRLPDNELGQACLQFLRQFGVGVGKIIRGGDRLGLYFLEMGAAQRSSKVIYDRAHSSFATLSRGMIDWRSVLTDATWLHWSGIIPAISAEAADVCLEALQIARDLGLTISCDLNYRARLWTWGRSAGEVMPELVKYCDVLIGSTESVEKVFGICRPEDQSNAEGYRGLCRALIERFPNLQTVAIALRSSLSATHNTWSGVLWERGSFYTAPVYDIPFIVDRVGTGDAFVAGLIYGFLAWGANAQRALDFAVAASCLKHSLFGDANLVTVGEVERLLGGDSSIHILR